MVPWLAAANRDAARFPEADRFSVHRTSTGHLAFGHGIHFCIGALLARLAAKIALGILLERYHGIAVDDDGLIKFHNPWVTISVKRLPSVVELLERLAQRDELIESLSAELGAAPANPMGRPDILGRHWRRSRMEKLRSAWDTS